jgi:Protein of unknown function (DUF3152)
LHCKPVEAAAAMKSVRSWSWIVVVAVLALIVFAKAYSLYQENSALSANRAKVSSAVRPRPVQVPENGSGVLVTLAGVEAGASKAPSSAEMVRVRVQMEEGLSAALRQEPTAFAQAVVATLNDDRSWSNGGQRTFVHSDGAPDVIIILATPETTNTLCRPLRTLGRLSCSRGQRAILNARRWIEATPEFTDLQLYRDYLVNHEVGHVLGQRHENCPGPGKLAPVMQQQTKRVAPCLPNAWPHSR